MPCNVIHVSPMSGAKAQRDLSLGQSAGASGDKDPPLLGSHQSNGPRAPHSFPGSPTPLAAQDHPAQHLFSPFPGEPWSQDRTLLKEQERTGERTGKRTRENTCDQDPESCCVPTAPSAQKPEHPQSTAGAGEWRGSPPSSPETKARGVG